MNGDTSDEDEPPDVLNAGDPLLAAGGATGPMRSARANDSGSSQVKGAELDNRNPSMNAASVAAQDVKLYAWNPTQWRADQRRVMKDQVTDQ